MSQSPLFHSVQDAGMSDTQAKSNIPQSRDRATDALNDQVLERLNVDCRFRNDTKSSEKLFRHYVKKISENGTRKT